MIFNPSHPSPDTAYLRQSPLLQVIDVDLARLELGNEDSGHDGIAMLRFLSQLFPISRLAKTRYLWPSPPPVDGSAVIAFRSDQLSTANYKYL